METLYDHAFYENRDKSTRASADRISSIVCNLVKINSVCDVGCGVGTWLAAFASRGAKEICGLDGDWVDQAKLVIPATDFLRADLSNPPSLSRTFDLAMSLEVAEHIPETKAEQFVNFLTSLAPVVMFSAAIPGQGGIGHINERWLNYWIKLFNDCGFVLLDCIRPKIWDSPDILLWYRQNTVLFARPESAKVIRLTGADQQATAGLPMLISPPLSMCDLVHPEMFSAMHTAHREISRKVERQSERLKRLAGEVDRLRSDQQSIRSNIGHLANNLMKKFALK